MDAFLGVARLCLCVLGRVCVGVERGRQQTKHNNSNKSNQSRLGDWNSDGWRIARGMARVVPGEGIVENELCIQSVELHEQNGGENSSGWAKLAAVGEGGGLSGRRAVIEIRTEDKKKARDQCGVSVWQARNRSQNLTDGLKARKGECVIEVQWE